MMDKKTEQAVSVMRVGGFGHAVWVFDEWMRDDANVRLVSAVQTLPDEKLDGFLAHPWAAQFTPPIYQDIDETLRTEQPDIVVISTRPDLNPDLIEKSLRAGCHVISEKPIAVDEAGLLRVHAAVEETGKFVLPMLGMHEVPAFAEARDLVEQGVIGEPLLVNARKSYQWGTRAEWFKQRETYGGIWGWIGIHSFNHAAHIIGRNATKVLAVQEQNRCHPEYAEGCADCMTGLFLLEGDVQMTVSVDLLRPDWQKAWGDDWVRIVGSEGSLEANPELGTIRLIRRGHDEELPTVTKVAPPFYTAFLTAVTEDADFSVLTSQGLCLTDTVLTAERAAVEGRYGLEVKPEYPPLNDCVNWLMATMELYPDTMGYSRYGVLSERTCPSDGLVIERYSDGTPCSTWFSYNGWAAANALEASTERLARQQAEA
jgi:predicted dehydrogenase